MVIISFLFTISQPKVNIAKNESQNHLIRIGLNHPPKWAYYKCYKNQAIPEYLITPNKLR